jgi:hypothetical protein
MDKYTQSRGTVVVFDVRKMEAAAIYGVDSRVAMGGWSVLQLSTGSCGVKIFGVCVWRGDGPAGEKWRCGQAVRLSVKDGTASINVWWLGLVGAGVSGCGGGGQERTGMGMGRKKAGGSSDAGVLDAQGARAHEHKCIAVAGEAPCSSLGQGEQASSAVPRQTSAVAA